MDADRRYTGESESWFGAPGGDGRAPAARGGDQYAGPDPRYGYGGPSEGEYGGTPYRDDTGSFTPGDQARRHRTGRPVRTNRRDQGDAGAGPEAYPGQPPQGYEPGGYDPAAYDPAGYSPAGHDQDAYDGPGQAAPGFEGADAPRRRAEIIDREALRRDDPPYAPGMQPGMAPQSAPPARQAPTAPQADPGTRTAIGLPTQPMPSAGPSPASVYTARRPGYAMLIGILGVASEILLVVVLIHGLFTHGLDVGAILGSLLALAGTPLTGIGLYALVCGAASTEGAHPGRAWLRTPLAYLPVGLILLIAAGLAI